ncbi:MAG: response regulator [Rhodocyclaceae bacterium]|nr:response regulator [Rhodocyclaceae bacterium]MDZ4214907.1 response regulator [Rhodocyclaceae bacterium]
MNILLVDHTSLYRNILEQALGEYEDFVLFFADSAKEAFEVAHQTDVQFVIVTQHLDDGGGVDLIRQLRQSGRFLHEPMILLTSSPSQELNSTAEMAGVTEVFRKQDIQELLNFLRRFLGIYSALSGRVLYIEDETSQRLALKTQLQEWGLQVDAYPSADAAWEAYLRNDYDLVLTDINMPGRMSGSRFINRVRRMSGAKGSVLILALTAFDTPARRIELFYLGIDDYVGKPVALLELRARIQNLLARKNALDRIRLMLSATMIGVVVVGEQGLIQMFNPEAEKLFGATESEMLDRPVAAIFADPEGEDSELLVTKPIAAGKFPCHIDALGRRKDGSSFFAHLVLEQLDVVAGSQQYALMVRDLTSERLLAERLIYAKDAAEIASRIKSDFLANMSHEIRTPMNAVIGLAHLCLQTDLTPKQRDYLEKINTSGKLMVGILNDLLDYSKIEAGRMELENAPFALADVAKNLRAVFEAKALEKGLAFECTVSPALPSVLRGDPLRLGQILINLIGNAIKFTAQGSVRVALMPDADNDADPTAIILRATVRDSGVGMTADQIDRVFQAFSQADSSITRKFGGTGLGLSISKRLVELMGGQIGVDSRPGEGTCFTFTARMSPFEGSPADFHAHARPVTDGRTASRLKGARVLLVEDNDVNQQVAQELLERAGVAVVIAENGQEALKELAQQEYDAVLMDLQMPVMDGLTATREIRRQEKYRNLPVIAMTANAMANDRERCLEVGMNDHIGKPIDVSELYAVLAQYLPAKEAVEPDESFATAAGGITVELPELSSLNSAAGIKRVGGDAPLYLDILFKFLDRQQDFGERMRELLRDPGQREAAERLAHTFKGLAATIGANDLAGVARELEEMIRDGADVEASLVQLEVTEKLLAEVLAEIAGIGYLRPAPAEAAPGTQDVARLLDEARTLLDSYNAEAEGPVTQLSAALAGTAWAARAAQVRELVGRYDYEAAAEELAQLDKDMRGGRDGGA